MAAVYKGGFHSDDDASSTLPMPVTMLPSNPSLVAGRPRSSLSVPNYDPLVNELRKWITSDPARGENFETAIHAARRRDIAELRDIGCWEDYLRFVDEHLHWVPSETVRPRDLLVRVAIIWFVLDQPAVAQHQSPTRPALGGPNQASDNLTWLSNWMVRFSNAIGTYMDTPESGAKLDTYRTSPLYHINDYSEPRGGWRTFNDFFARHVKPGRRPIAAIGNGSILTSPADFRFQELHSIQPDSTVTTKGVAWPIAQILANSLYKDRFANGVWLHGFLNLDDYHRIHAPVAGRVLEARVIPGNNYMQVEVGSDEGSELKVLDDVGYQFCQSRGLVVLDTGHGLVAVLPVGMAIVSSVVLTAEVGEELHKGEELGYFQFGGSDVVLLLEHRLGAEITMGGGKHYRMGSEIGRLSIPGY